MGPKKPETTGEGDLFRARLDQIINMKLIAWPARTAASHVDEKSRRETVRSCAGAFVR
jgi:hypothetical protein